mmetsp:Transcript_12366/g.46124  ORF Transcript_12366/g.46124 Transcript_12366/m.46124 type:complete len:278 (+) Transcript_12366:67-900(+)
MHVRIKHHALFRRALHGSAVRGERLGDAGFAEFKRVELMVRDSFQGSHLRFSRRRARVELKRNLENLHPRAPQRFPPFSLPRAATGAQNLCEPNEHGRVRDEPFVPRQRLVQARRIRQFGGETRGVLRFFQRPLLYGFVFGKRFEVVARGGSSDFGNKREQRGDVEVRRGDRRRFRRQRGFGIKRRAPAVSRAAQKRHNSRVTQNPRVVLPQRTGEKHAHLRCDSKRTRIARRPRVPLQRQRLLHQPARDAPFLGFALDPIRPAPRHDVHLAHLVVR